MKRKIITRIFRSYNFGPVYIVTGTNPWFIEIQWIGFGKLHPNQCELEVEEEEPHE